MPPWSSTRDLRERLRAVLAEHGHYHVQHDLGLQGTSEEEEEEEEELEWRVLADGLPAGSSGTLVRSVAVHSTKTFFVFMEIFEWSPGKTSKQIYII